MSSDHQIVDKAVKLSLVELVIGSTVHALHIPMAGQILSINQGFMLTRFQNAIETRIDASKMVMEVSSVASLMKALAPVGKKLGPMISISMQGFLYMLGILTFGKNLLGQMVGMALLSPWAFIQPLVTYFVIYGQDFTKALDYFASKNEMVYDFILFAVVGKAVLCACVPLVLHFLPEEKITRLEQKLEKASTPKTRKKNAGSPTMSAFLELFRPMFLLSLLLMISFFLISGESGISIFWKVMRAFAVAFSIFYIARNTYVHGFISKLAKKSKLIERLYELSAQASKRITNLQ
ncbi:MAG: hypothetical protein COW01_04070 [Bdellovibrionales bacterium CG12_big_fil_rev_8_21_14_0_65_38_15]|nr:MAG: hypothetical protein COW79_12865 [Bdellovibrionales bacterium CG22_combo_CG10-13_8_21_14_all_38_13]PIQ56640.1 MAG: hypothetical protein COW01_04070 [Bdellovibrionales bacterium CG12_big_fil_rev_8_21_14_0_65_38_15]PIR31243.1 MAG: hypothetical protein COV38_01420 [Bdellovibrionales bacterium CG11_big_fil_rev_8_21_14_0_20_38_13]